MIIEPKARGFICVTTHPTGCDANVLEQIKLVKKKGKVENGPKKVLVIVLFLYFYHSRCISGSLNCYFFIKSKTVKGGAWRFTPSVLLKSPPSETEGLGKEPDCGRTVWFAGGDGKINKFASVF